MVLGRTVRKARGILESLAVPVFEECKDTDVDPAGRERSDRSAGAEPGTLSRGETVWCDYGSGAVSAGASWVSGREAPRRHAEEDGGLAGEVCERSRSGSRDRQPVKRLAMFEGAHPLLFLQVCVRT